MSGWRALHCACMSMNASRTRTCVCVCHRYVCMCACVCVCDASARALGRFVYYPVWNMRRRVIQSDSAEARRRTLTMMVSFLCSCRNKKRSRAPYIP